jgi:hypothetical protein
MIASQASIRMKLVRPRAKNALSVLLPWPFVNRVVFHVLQELIPTRIARPLVSIVRLDINNLSKVQQPVTYALSLPPTTNLVKLLVTTVDWASMVTSWVSSSALIVVSVLSRTNLAQRIARTAPLVATRLKLANSNV